MCSEPLVMFSLHIVVAGFFEVWRPILFVKRNRR